MNARLRKTGGLLQAGDARNLSETGTVMTRMTGSAKSGTTTSRGIITDTMITTRTDIVLRGTTGIEIMLVTETMGKTRIESMVIGRRNTTEITSAMTGGEVREGVVREDTKTGTRCGRVFLSRRTGRRVRRFTRTKVLQESENDPRRSGSMRGAKRCVLGSHPTHSGILTLFQRARYDNISVPEGEPPRPAGTDAREDTPEEGEI